MRCARASVLALCVLLLGIAGRAQVVPPGLPVGDPYHLVFVTHQGRDATSSDIADYDAFVRHVGRP